MADKGNDAVARLFAWLDADAPESAAHDLLFQLMIPHDALEIALGAELRAQAFFEQVLEHTADPRPREALARTPDPHVDWEQVFAQR